MKPCTDPEELNALLSASTHSNLPDVSVARRALRLARDLTDRGVGTRLLRRGYTLRSSGSMPEK